MIKNLKKKDIQNLSGITAASVAKLGRNGSVTTDVLLKVCLSLQCDISDIMEIRDGD